ncbi:hypothetical protein [Pedobacter endophyticus]|uniref:Uncharacterized protein n=1 Tax=Pedobacter endophyticus TaxID=2789740 RepID=A0A7S9L1V1_9SPHI|nr:hypothetical protein [Pedobacter endophyticus]QPH40959.1 hypothetical protein IZT61_06770 [Pedobacter endophyticus]
MKDTSDEIKEMQLKLWLAKAPQERLRQMLIDNESLYVFWANLKPAGTRNIINKK